MLRFQKRAALPLLTDLQLDWGGARVTDVYPAPLPDLYAGQTLSVLARFHSTGTTRVMLRGRTRRGAYEQALDVEWPASTPDRSAMWQALPQVWARPRIDSLTTEARDTPERTSPVRDEVLSLALAYHLLSPYTSFVAVEERRDEHGQRAASEPVVVPIHLPQGTRREAFEQPRGGFAGGAKMLYAMAMPSPAGGAVRAKLSRSPAGMQASPSAPAPSVAGFFGRLGDGLREAFGGAPVASAPQAHATTHISDESVHSPASMVVPPGERVAAALRYLARTQSVNGSWDNSETATALALLAFLAQGASDRAGNFRPQLTRAIAWLTDKTERSSSALIAWTLAELAATTGAPAHIAARDRALTSFTLSDDVEQICAALARRAAGQQVALPQLPPVQYMQPPTDEQSALAILLRSFSDIQTAQTAAQQLASLQSQRDASSGAVVSPGVQANKPDAAVFAATALGALLWGDASARLRGIISNSDKHLR